MHGIESVVTTPATAPASPTAPRPMPHRGAPDVPPLADRERRARIGSIVALLLAVGPVAALLLALATFTSVEDPQALRGVHT